MTEIIGMVGPSYMQHKIEFSDETLRDQFAMAALTGLDIEHGHTFSCEYGEDQASGHVIDTFWVEKTCKTAYAYADAMIEARKQNANGDE
jgi:hypothetical protein